MQHPLHHRLLLAMFFSASVVAAATTSSEATRVHNLRCRRSNRKQEQQPPSIHFSFKNINHSTTSTARASLLTTTSRRENATTPHQHAGDISDSHSTTASSLQKPISRRGAQTNLLLFICVARRIMKSQHSGVVPRLSFTNSVDSIPMNGTLITPLHPAVAVTTVVHVKRKFQKKKSASSLRKFIDRMVLPHEDELSSESICHQRTSIVESMLTKMIHGMLFFLFFLVICTKGYLLNLWFFLFLFYSRITYHTLLLIFFLFLSCWRHAPFCSPLPSLNSPTGKSPTDASSASTCVVDESNCAATNRRNDEFYECSSSDPDERTRSDSLRDLFAGHAHAHTQHDQGRTETELLCGRKTVIGMKNLLKNVPCPDVLTEQRQEQMNRLEEEVNFFFFWNLKVSKKKTKPKKLSNRNDSPLIFWFFFFLFFPFLLFLLLTKKHADMRPLDKTHLSKVATLVAFVAVAAAWIAFLCRRSAQGQHTCASLNSKKHTKNSRTKHRKSSFPLLLQPLGLLTTFVGLYGCVMSALFASAQQVFEGGTALKTAVNSWCSTSTRTSAESTYGSIVDWDVSRVESMTNLFNGQQTCNPDISKWDVSSATSMKQSESFFFPRFYAVVRWCVVVQFGG